MTPTPNPASVGDRMLDSLGRRPRGRRLARWLGRERPAAEAVAPTWDPLARELAVHPPATPGPVTAALHSRLDRAELDAMRSRITESERALLHNAPDERRRSGLELSLSLATVPSAEQTTRLRALDPPAEVHAIMR